ncbi:MAG: DHHA1 domain-containing protein, partial [Pseudomonadota bacterium]
AAGVVFMTLVATTRVLRKRGHYAGERSEPSLIAWLDMVALATVCDVVPLVGLNKAFVTQGLTVMGQRRNPGLRALGDVAGLTSAPNPYHLGFVLGPRINAGGRIGRSSLGAELLTLDDDQAAGQLAGQLDQLNRERKAMETTILEEARAMGEARIAAEPETAVLCVAGDTWHKGLVGLVASRLTEQFGRPTCVLAWADDGTGTGSLRSLPGVDIGGLVRRATADGLLLKGGGHAMAAGLTVAREKYDLLQAFFRLHASAGVAKARANAGTGVDGPLTAGGATIAFAKQLEQAGPFGIGNPTPRFAFPSHHVRGAKIVGENHVRASIVSADGSRLAGIAFRAAGTELGNALLHNDGRPLHILGTIKRDTWGGREKVDLTIEDVADPQAARTMS